MDFTEFQVDTSPIDFHARFSSDPFAADTTTDSCNGFFGFQDEYLDAKGKRMLKYANGGIPWRAETVRLRQDLIDLRASNLKVVDISHLSLTLDVDRNRLAHILPDSTTTLIMPAVWFGALPDLSKTRLRKIVFDNAFIDGEFDATQLPRTLMYIKIKSLRTTAFTSMRHLSELISLSILSTSTPLSNEIFDKKGLPRSLEKLTLSGCGFTKVPKIINKLPNLESLDLRGNPISTISITHNNIDMLKIGGPDRLCPIDLRMKIIKVPRHLSSIDISGLEWKNVDVFKPNLGKYRLARRRDIPAHYDHYIWMAKYRSRIYKILDKHSINGKKSALPRDIINLIQEYYIDPIFLTKS